MMAKTMIEIEKELSRARAKWPSWPTDQIHAAAIVCEEASELIREAVRCRYEGGNPDDLRKAAIHVAATAARFLEGK